MFAKISTAGLPTGRVRKDYRVYKYCLSKGKTYHDNRKDPAFIKKMESDFPIRHLNVQRENFSDIQTVYQDAVDRIEGEREFSFEWNYNKRGTRWTL